jgi:hypothetical protein
VVSDAGVVEERRLPPSLPRRVVLDELERDPLLGHVVEAKAHLIEEPGASKQASKQASNQFESTVRTNRKCANFEMEGNRDSVGDSLSVSQSQKTVCDLPNGGSTHLCGGSVPEAGTTAESPGQDGPATGTGRRLLGR